MSRATQTSEASGAYRLEGAHALVTGGGTGIGAAIAARLSGAGARVTVAGRRAEPLRGVAGGLETAQAVPFDVTDEGEVEAGLAEAVERFGPVDVLVNNAGAAESSPFARTTLDAWSRMLEVNLTGAFLVTRAVLPGMVDRRRGRVVTVASTAGLKGYPYVAAYCAAKHGVIGMTRALALEVARKGVTVNAVCPGYTETDLLAQSVANIVEKTGADEAGARARLVEGNPQGRFVSPEEVAEAVGWILGPNAEAINGQAIAVDGGEVA
ncbi:SDR family NAD(P)-dependent oxidoreductase [Rubrobacter marinus]|uniref:SDR family NAD(P)-dependent oxidoreductase n=1 Tax=Rubrobacter marinus TaxID=2653852 RepID=A0A6G8Q0T8_9ACTN|nr:SDR family NAD(P)-dependent oxidoreductase [Rubrobacter marinus]QIN80094.1 SDR family NAD(P)-dependent oxidoreductase [Rubrobacter marinus]